MSGVFRNIDLPPPQRRGWGRRGGVKSSEDARHCSVLYICKYFVIYAIYLCTVGGRKARLVKTVRRIKLALNSGHSHQKLETAGHQPRKKCFCKCKKSYGKSWGFSRTLGDEILGFEYDFTIFTKVCLRCFYICVFLIKYDITYFLTGFRFCHCC
jgi:hypothetical protein